MKSQVLHTVLCDAIFLGWRKEKLEMLTLGSEGVNKKKTTNPLQHICEWSPRAPDQRHTCLLSWTSQNISCWDCCQGFQEPYISLFRRAGFPQCPRYPSPGSAVQPAPSRQSHMCDRTSPGCSWSWCLCGQCRACRWSRRFPHANEQARWLPTRLAGTSLLRQTWYDEGTHRASRSRDSLW